MLCLMGWLNEKVMENNESLFEILMPVLDNMTLTALKIQQLNKKKQYVPKELFDIQSNLKDELVELLLLNNAIKFNLTK